MPKLMSLDGTGLFSSSPVAAPFAWIVPGAHLSVDGMTLTRNTDSGNQPTGGVAANHALVGDGSISFVPTATNKEVSVGFGPGELPVGTYGPRFDLVANDDGNVYAIDGGVITASLGAFAPGDTLTVRRVGATITAEKNGSTIHTYAASVLTPLRAAAHVETSGYSVVTSRDGAWASEPFTAMWPTWSIGALITQVQTHIFARNDAGGTWEAPGAGVAAESLLDAAGSLLYVPDNSALAGPRLVSLSQYSNRQAIGLMAYSIDCDGSTLYVIELGSTKYTGTYQVGDMLEIRVAADGTVTYHQNGTLRYTSLADATGVRLYPQFHVFGAYTTNPATTVSPYLSGAWA